MKPAIDIQPIHLAMVRDILQKNIPEHTVWVFGSRAKGNAKPYSDLDLAIITDKPLNPAVMATLVEDFSESDLPWKVDVVDWSMVSDIFRQVIKQDKIVLQPYPYSLR